MLKVVINALSARRGGGQTYLINLLQHLDGQSGIEVVVLVSGAIDLPTHSTITIFQTPRLTRNPLLRTAWERVILPAILHRLRADILFCPGGLVNTKVPQGCHSVSMFRNMIPFDMNVRNQYPFGRQRLRNWLLERVMLSSMLRSDLVIFISDYARQVIEGRLNGRKLNSVTIPHGLSDHFRIAGSNRPPRPSWLPTEDYLLYVSLFEVYKHQLEVVRGYHLLKSRRVTPEKLILAGQLLEPAALEVRAEIVRLGLQDDVILTGNIPYRELPAVYAHAKINIFASTCENCPNILLEAMGAGRPLLVSDRQPMPEFGRDAAVYFDPLSPENFADQLEELIDDASRLDFLAECVVEQSRRFRWDETAKRTWAVIAELGAGDVVVDGF